MNRFRCRREDGTGPGVRVGRGAFHSLGYSVCVEAGVVVVCVCGVCVWWWCVCGV